jgi:hypothetical protein
MLNTCDICGFNHIPNDRYCGRCNVDLKEAKIPGEQKPNPETNWSFDEKEKSSSKKKQPENKKVTHWCTIRAVCNSFEMSFPTFLVVVLMLAKGEKVLGFCHCARCNRGYRELQAWIINGLEKKNLTAQSREIVIKASYDKIDGMTYDISELLGKYQEKSANQKSIERDDSLIKKTTSGKITIEIDSDVLEDAVVNILKSEKGREVIQSVPRKYTKKKD